MTHPTILLSPTDIEAQFTIRPVTMNDLDRIVEFLNIIGRHHIGTDEFSREDVEIEWMQEGQNLEKNLRVVLTPDDQIIAYVKTWDADAPYTELRAWVALHPDYEHIGLGEYLFQWAETRLRQSLHKAPAGAKIVMRFTSRSEKTAVQNAARAQGMELVRHFYRMAITFDDSPPPAPVWPEGITLRPFIKGQDDREVFTVFDTAFRDHWGYIPQPFEEALKKWQHWSVNRPDFDPALVFLAVNPDNKIVGIALGGKPSADMPGYGWVEDLAVLREGRGKGLGMALLLHAFGEFYRCGYQGSILGVDTENLSGALRLYEKAGMKPVSQMNIFKKTLRDGVEYTGESA